MASSFKVSVMVLFVEIAISSQQHNSPPSTEYGPPGSFTPGQPLETYRASNSANPQTVPCANTDLAANKQVVLDFYQKVFGDKRFDLLDKYIAEDVINHNPDEVDGRESVLQILNGPFGQGPPGKVDIRRVSAEDDLVWTHTRFPAPSLNKVFAIVDIFRINCAGMIQEHWDVIQDTSVNTTNPHPFF